MTVMAGELVASRPFENVKDDLDPGIFTENTGQVKLMARGSKSEQPRRRRSRRQSHGSAWHWKQADSWYYILPGTKRRAALFDEDGSRIRGIENRKAAQLALAWVKLGQGWEPQAPPTSPDEWIVAKVCSEYLQYCERGVANGILVVRQHRRLLSKADRDAERTLPRIRGRPSCPITDQLGLINVRLVDAALGHIGPGCLFSL
jgi:hypothetical protein